ncbi:MAG TPA: hypothetical protein VGH27_16615 [Streptosporangiaceae bacterium]|jgi:hypothetical protein
MGYGDLVEQAVEAAADDMGNVQAAADAIQGAVSKCQRLLTPQTWFGPSAQTWIGGWDGTYKTVLSCLGGLPGAEQSVIAAVQSKMEAQVAAMAKAADKQAATSTSS